MSFDSVLQEKKLLIYQGLHDDKDELLSVCLICKVGITFLSSVIWQ